jgi:hypothetical protein
MLNVKNLTLKRNLEHSEAALYMVFLLFYLEIK